MQGSIQPGENSSADERLPSQNEDARLQQRVVSAEDLLDGEREVLLLHRGQLYRLRETRNGKLILTK